MSPADFLKNGFLPKICQRCNLRFEWRQKLERDWGSLCKVIWARGFVGGHGACGNNYGDIIVLMAGDHKNR